MNLRSVYLARPGRKRRLAPTVALLSLAAWGAGCGPTTLKMRLENAERRHGSWWQAWADWVLAHGGEETTAPSAPGSTRHPALEAAPGRYVRDLPAD